MGGLERTRLSDEMPSDPMLPGTILLQDPERLGTRIQSLLTPWVGEQVQVLQSRVIVRRYVLGKRCIIELELLIRRQASATAEKLNLIGKFYRRDQGMKVYETLRQLSDKGFASGRFRVPQPIAYDAKWQLLLQTRASGELLYDQLMRGAETFQTFDDAALWLVKLHNCSIQSGLLYTFERQLITLKHWQRNIAQASAEHACVFDRILHQIEAWGAVLSDSIAGPTHRDFSPDHIMLNGNETTVFDFDEFCLYDSLFDVAHFVTRLKFLGLAYFGSLDHFDAVATRFQESYRLASNAYSPERVRLYQSIAFLKLAHITLLITRPHGWDQIGMTLLHEAEKLV